MKASIQIEKAHAETGDLYDIFDCIEFMATISSAKGGLSFMASEVKDFLAWTAAQTVSCLRQF